MRNIWYFTVESCMTYFFSFFGRIYTLCQHEIQFGCFSVSLKKIMLGHEIITEKKKCRMFFSIWNINGFISEI